MENEELTVYHNASEKENSLSIVIASLEANCYNFDLYYRIKIISSVAFTLNTLLSKRIKLNLCDPYVYNQYLKYQTK